MPRQRDAAELSCCRLVTLVTVAVQQNPASLIPEAQLNSKPSEPTSVNLASSGSLLSSCRSFNSSLKCTQETHADSNAAPTEAMH